MSRMLKHQTVNTKISVLTLAKVAKGSSEIAVLFLSLSCDRRGWGVEARRIKRKWMWSLISILAYWPVTMQYVTITTCQERMQWTSSLANAFVVLAGVRSMMKWQLSLFGMAARKRKVFKCAPDMTYHTVVERLWGLDEGKRSREDFQ